MGPPRDPRRPAGSFYAGGWLIEPQLARVSRDGISVHVRPQLLDLLGFLAERPEQVLSKQQILEAVWPAQYVVESALARCVAELRHILGDCARNPRIIQTVHKRGYRLLARVTWVAPDLPSGPAGSAGRPGPEASGLTPTAEADRDARHDPATAAQTDANRLACRAWPSVRWAIVAAPLAVAAGLLTFGLIVDTAPPSRPAGSARLLLADFTNRTGDPGLAETVRLALAAELQESGFLEVLSDSQSRSALRNLEKPVDTPITATVAMEVCTDQAADAFVGGLLAPFGGRVALGLEVIACGTGEVLARELVEARDKAQMRRALDNAARGLTRKLAGSLPSLRRAEHLRGPVWAQARQTARGVPARR